MYLVIGAYTDDGEDTASMFWFDDLRNAQHYGRLLISKQTPRHHNYHPTLACHYNLYHVYELHPDGNVVRIEIVSDMTSTQDMVYRHMPL